MKHIDEYRDPGISRKFVEKIRKTSRKPIRLMEVCGTHTMSIFRNGIGALLPETISLVSGPGCPVCVTAQNEIDAFAELAGRDEVIVAAFGDLMRVPGANSSLSERRADGGDVRVVYSASNALEIAKKNPDKKIVFPGIGFETAVPTVAASILEARETGLENFSVFSAHKLVTSALFALMRIDGFQVDGFILPGHASVIIGMDAYRPFFNLYGIPCVVAGFEPDDILQAVCMLVSCIESGSSELKNAYTRAVTDGGNKKAQKIIADVFEISDAGWRGLGKIQDSGMQIREEFAEYDARKVFDCELGESAEPEGCACGKILTGLKTPPECPLYKKTCTPEKPAGPCMVSSEGTCAAYCKYK